MGRVKHTSASTVAGLALVCALVGSFGYFTAMHTFDIQAYRGVGRQLLNQDYDIYPAVAEGGFRYAPVTALLFVPLALVPVSVAALVVFLLKVITLLAITAMVLRLMGIDRARYARVCLLSFLVTGGYLVEEFRTGNIHFLSLGLVVVVIYLVERGRTTAPSFLLALAIALKLTPLLFVFYFALRRRFRLCAYTLMALLVLLALPAVFVGIEANTSLLEGFVESADQKLDEPKSQSLRGALFRYLNANAMDSGLLPPVNVVSLSAQSVSALWYALSACVLLGLVGVMAARRPSEDSAILEYALVTVLILVLSPHSLRLYFSTLFFPCCVLLGLLIKYPSHPFRILIQLGLGLTFGVGSLAPLILPGRDAALLYEALSPHFVSAFLSCVLLGLLIVTRNTLPLSRNA